MSAARNEWPTIHVDIDCFNSSDTVRCNKGNDIKTSNKECITCTYIYFFHLVLLFNEHIFLIGYNTVC